MMFKPFTGIIQKIIEFYLCTLTVNAVALLNLSFKKLRYNPFINILSQFSLNNNTKIKKRRGNKQIRVTIQLCNY